METRRKQVGYFYLFLFVIFLYALSACFSFTSESSEFSSKDSPKGWLVYGGGGDDIWALNLETGEKSLIHSEDQTVLNISKGDTDEFYFDHCAGGCVIKKFDLKTDEVSVLYEGKSPTYLREHQMLLFFQDDKLRSKKMNIGKIGEESIETIHFENHSKSIKLTTLTPLQISKNAVLLLDQKENIYKFNLLTKEITLIEINNCLPLSLLEGRNKIICLNTNHRKHEIVSLETLKRRTLDIRVAAAHAKTIYSSPYNALIYTSTPTFALWEYHYIYWTNLTTFETFRIGPGSIGSGFWVEELNLN